MTNETDVDVERSIRAYRDIIKERDELRDKIVDAHKETLDYRDRLEKQEGVIKTISDEYRSLQAQFAMEKEARQQVETRLAKTEADRDYYMRYASEASNLISNITLLASAGINDLKQRSFANNKPGGGPKTEPPEGEPVPGFLTQGPNE